MIAFLIACHDGGSDPSKTTSSGPSPTTPIPVPTEASDPFTPFEPGLTLVVDGSVVGDGGSIDLGRATMLQSPTLTTLQLVNPTNETLSMPGDPDGWLTVDDRVVWEVPPPASIAAGEVALATLALVPDSTGPVAGSLSVEGVTLQLSGFVDPTPLTLVIGRLGRVLLSDDYGATFYSDTQENLDPAASEWSDDPKTEDLAYGAGRFVAVGGAGEPTIRWSEDGVLWVTVDPPVGLGTIEAVAYGDGQFVISSGGSLATSTNGEVWIVNDGPSWRPALSAMVYAENRFVGVGGTRRATTLDGVTWETDVDAGMSLSGLAYGNGRFVGVGSDGGIASSDDGITWSESWTGTADRYGIAYGGGVFVSGGWPDDQLLSSDGVTFQLVPGTEQVGPLGYAYEAFLGTGWPNRLLRSFDGITWSEVAAADDDLAGLTDVATAE